MQYCEMDHDGLVQAVAEAWTAWEEERIQVCEAHRRELAGRRGVAYEWFPGHGPPGQYRHDLGHYPGHYPGHNYSRKVRLPGGQRRIVYTPHQDY